MKTAQDWLYCIGGALLFSFSMNVFLVPLHIYSTGFLGTVQLLRDLLLHILPYRLSFGIAGIINLIPNIFMITLAAKVLAKTFTVYTAIVILFESLFLSLIPMPKVSLVEDVFISTLLGSFLCAYGTRLFFKGRESGGGIDIVGLYLTRTGKGSVGNIYLLVNTVVHLLCFLIYDSQVASYSIVHSCILSFVLDHIHEDNAELVVLIITENHEPKQQLILDVERGVTVWDGTGGYSGRRKEVMMVAITRGWYGHLKKQVQGCDEQALAIFFDHTRISGYLLKLINEKRKNRWGRVQTKKQRVYHCWGIVKQLNAYTKADKLLILCESGVLAEIRKDITAQFLEATCYTVPGIAHIKTFDNLKAIVRFLYQSGCRKESSLLIVGNQ